MKKSVVIFAIILIVVLAGFIYWELNFPFSITSVNIPENIGTYSVNKSEKAHGKLLFGTEYTPRNENFAEWCIYSSYNPNPSLDTIYACEPSQGASESLELWINTDRNFLTIPEPGAIKFSEGSIVVDSVNVKTLTVSEANCGNPGYCTRYYWQQGKLIFKADGNLDLVRGFIQANDGLFSPF